MAVKFEFYLRDKDFNRLYAIKKQQGKDLLSGNQYAKELLEGMLHKMHPSVPLDVDDDCENEDDEYEEEECQTYCRIKVWAVRTNSIAYFFEIEDRVLY